MSDTDSNAPSPSLLPDQLLALLMQWISTSTWEQSKELLKGNAELLLSDEAVATLDALLLAIDAGDKNDGNVRNDEDDEGDDEDKDKYRAVVAAHKRILEQARATSIDDAYVELLSDDDAEPDAFAEALQAIVDADSPAAVIEQIQQHPMLLETRVVEAIEALTNKLQKDEQSDLAGLIAERLETLKQVIAANNDPFNLALQALMNAKSPAEVIDQIRQHPILLESDTLTRIEEFITNLREDDQSGLADHIAQRLETLRQLIEANRDPLNLAINALMQSSSGTLRQVIARHPVLLDDETLANFEAFATQIEQSGDSIVAAQLRLRLAEVRRINGENRQSAGQSTSSVQEEEDYAPQYESSGVYASGHHNIIVGRDNPGSIVQTNVQDLHIEHPPEKWLESAAPEPDSEKPFIGRVKELHDLRNYILAGESVIISGKQIAVQGMGGIGKTYLAKQLATEVKEQFPGGVITLVLVERDAQDILRELAGYAFGGTQPSLLEQMRPEIVKAWLQGTAPGRFLVIFDDVWNGEILSIAEQAIPDGTVRIVTTRDASIAVTIGGKHIKLDHMELEDGIALLENRLDCKNNAAIHDILETFVTFLEGHALSLEIIAARIKLEGSENIAYLLKELQEGVGRELINQLELREKTREKSLEKSLALSYRYMTDEEKRHFRKLGVFALESPITLESSAAIWNIEDHKAVRKALQNLVNLAMLEKSGDSYRQHSLLHAYAYALMEDADELNGTRWAHAEYYRELALRAETATPKDYPLLDRHTQNLQSALEWSKEHEPPLFSQLVEVLFQFLQLRGQSRKLEEYLPVAVDIAERTGHPGRQANLRKSLGDLESRLGNVDEARTHYDAALPLFRLERNQLGEANLLQSLGDLESRLGNVDEARKHYDAALPLYRQERARLGEANLLQSLGDLESRLGNIDEARTHYDAALPLFRLERNQLGEANIYRSVAEIFVLQRNLAEASTYFERALQLYIAERTPIGQANTLLGLGIVYFESGEQEQGKQTIQEAINLYRSMQDNESANQAELLLAQMQGQTLSEQTHSEIDIALVNSFVNTQSSQEMFQLVQQHSEMLTDTWLEAIEVLMEAQEDEQLKGAISERLDSLRQIRQVLEQNAVAEASKKADRVIEFIRGDWNHRQQMLSQHADILLNADIETVVKLLVQANDDTRVKKALEDVGTLLRRCRTWGVEPVFYFALHMRLGDSIEIPLAFEDTIMQVAALRSRENDRMAAWAEATVLIETLLNRLTADVPPLFEAALLRDLAETMAALPVNHPARKLATIEACYREALSLYEATDRPISVANVQRAIGDILSASGRYEESLTFLQAAAQGLQEYEHTRKEAAWAFSAYASALDKVGRIDEAIANYTEAIRLLPDTPALLRNHSESLIHAWQLDEAEADLARAVELDGNEDSPYLWFHRAQLALARGDGPQADQMLDEVLKRDPAMDVRLQRAESAWVQGDLEMTMARLHTAFDMANVGKRAAMRRELLHMSARYPDLPTLPAKFL